MKKNLIMMSVLAGTISMSAQTTLKTKQDSLSYALGVSMAESLKKSGVTDYDQSLFLEGIKAQLSGKSVLTTEQSDQMYRQEQKRIAEEKNAMARKGGEEFLAKNKTAPGVVTTMSGLQYKTTKEGTGISPSATDKVTVHYHGTLTDGTIFDSSVDRGQPATFGLNQVIVGWTEGLQLMKEGGKTTFYIPQALAYGPRAQGKIPGYSTLIFDVELIKVDKLDNTQKPQQGQPTSPKPTTKPKEVSPKK